MRNPKIRFGYTQFCGSTIIQIRAGLTVNAAEELRKAAPELQVGGGSFAYSTYIIGIVPQQSEFAIKQLIKRAILMSKIEKLQREQLNIEQLIDGALQGMGECDMGHPEPLDTL